MGTQIPLREVIQRKPRNLHAIKRHVIHLDRRHAAYGRAMRQHQNVMPSGEQLQQRIRPRAIRRQPVEVHLGLALDDRWPRVNVYGRHALRQVDAAFVQVRVPLFGRQHRGLRIGHRAPAILANPRKLSLRALIGRQPALRPASLRLRRAHRRRAQHNGAS